MEYKVLQEKNMNVPKVNILFWVGFFIELLIVGVNLGELDLWHEEELYWVAVGFFSLKILLTKYNKKEKKVVIILGVLTLIATVFTHDVFFIGVMTMVIASKNIERDKALKYLFYVMLSMTMIYFILSCSGIFGTNAITEDFGRTGIETRFCFGEKHPNNFHASVWMIVLLGFYLYFEKIKVYHFVLALVINIVLFQFTVSKTGFFITCMIVCMTAFMKYSMKWKDSKWLYILGVAVLFLCLLFSLSIVFLGTAFPGMKMLDRALTGRISVAQLQIQDAKLLFLGNKYSWINTEIGYLRLFFSFGILFAILYVVAEILLIRESYIKKEYMVFVVIITVTIVSVVESHALLIYIGRDLLLLLLFGRWNVFTDLRMKKNRINMQDLD